MVNRRGDRRGVHPSPTSAAREPTGVEIDAIAEEFGAAPYPPPLARVAAHRLEAYRLARPDYWVERWQGQVRNDDPGCPFRWLLVAVFWRAGYHDAHDPQRLAALQLRRAVLLDLKAYMTAGGTMLHLWERGRHAMAEVFEGHAKLPTTADELRKILGLGQSRSRFVGQLELLAPKEALGCPPTKLPLVLCLNGRALLREPHRASGERGRALGPPCQETQCFVALARGLSPPVKRAVVRRCSAALRRLPKPAPVIDSRVGMMSPRPELGPVLAQAHPEGSR
jgi:hypothetical protein